MTKKKRIMKLEMDVRELTVRLAEAGCEVKRGPGLTTAEAHGDLIALGIAENYSAMAHAALGYFAEVLKKHGTLHQVPAGGKNAKSVH